MGNTMFNTNKINDRRFVEDLDENNGLYITDDKKFVKLHYVTHKVGYDRGGLSFIKVPFTKADLTYIKTLDVNKIYNDKFGELNHEYILEDGMDALLCAIVERAVEDYKWSYRMLKKVERMKQEGKKLNEYDKYRNNQAEFLYGDCRHFFDSEWCLRISPVHPDTIKEKLYGDEQKFYKRCEKKDKEMGLENV